MLQINPQEYFPVVRQLDDPYDTGTYYVRAIIRNALTDAIIDTLDLTDNGNQRFSKRWQAIADVSGLGTYITIETTVYTDSGYTTKSERYSLETREHLIQKRTNPTIDGGGGGVDIDYKKIKQLMVDCIQEYVKLPKDFDIEPLMLAIRTGNSELFTSLATEFTERLRAEKPESYNDTQIRVLLSGISQQIADIPKPEKVDFGPLEEKIQGLTNASEEERISLATEVMRIRGELLEALKPEDNNTMLQNIYDYLQSIDSVTMVKSPKLPEVKEPTPQKRDPASFASRLRFNNP